MGRVDREGLRQSLEKHLDTGEVLLAWGLGALGFRTVPVAATDRRLILLTREAESLDYSRIEAVEAGPGDSALPGWAKIDIGNAVMNAMTTHLVVKPLGDPPRHYLFRPYPSYSENRAAGIQIGRAILSVRPSLPGGEALGICRRSRPGKAVWWKWALRTGCAGAVVVAVLSRAWEGSIAGFVLGSFVGGFCAPAWNVVRTIASGKG